jgi:hypothetical protein
VIVAATAWPDAAIAIAGILFITVVLSVAIWQILATGRAGLSARREQAYRKVAEDGAEAQRRASEQLETAVAEIAYIRKQTAELERLLKEVE